jgi:hypothetical protein
MKLGRQENQDRTPMKPLAKTQLCRQCVRGRFLPTECRDLEGGRAWRGSLMTWAAVPGDLVDFACPLGRPWGWRPDAAKPSPPSGSGAPVAPAGHRRTGPPRRTQGADPGRRSTHAAAVGRPPRRHADDLDPHIATGLSHPDVLVLTGQAPKRLQTPPGAEGTCLSCPDSRACPNVTTCCGGQVEVNITTPCPRGKW